jgi:tRNA pseudouridine13 synthase
VSIRAIDHEDIEKGLYSIYDVVLPTPGYEVQYPANVEQKYKVLGLPYQTMLCSSFAANMLSQDLLGEDGLTFEHLKNPQQRDFSLRGNYRKMLLKPKRMSWELKRYVDKTVRHLRGCSW